MRIATAEFLKSASAPASWPDEGPREIAFCGRSNVGKSTLLNAVLGRKGMARVSRTPGRTRLINFFSLTVVPEGTDGGGRAQKEKLLLSDLPGFGYAKVSKVERSTWRPLIQSYLDRRQSLRAVVLLCDSRRAAKATTEPELLFDEDELCRWLLHLGRKVVVVMTKADKLSKHERKPAAEALRRLLGKSPVIFSSLTGEGTDELWRRIFSALKEPAAATLDTDTNAGASTGGGGL